MLQETQSQSQPEVKSLNRGRLKSALGECRFLLSALGLDCAQASGEAEGMCAAMSAAGKVDAVVTEDSDAFCYGARAVLRNFSAGGTGAAKTITAELYRVRNR